VDIITILTSLLTLAIAIIAYFAKSLIEDVKKDVKLLRSEVTAMKQDSIWITNTVGELKDMQAYNTKEQRAILSKLAQKIDLIKDNEAHIEGRLNAQDKHLENYGQVIRVLVSKK